MKSDRVNEVLANHRMVTSGKHIEICEGYFF